VAVIEDRDRQREDGDRADDEPYLIGQVDAFALFDLFDEIIGLFEGRLQRLAPSRCRAGSTRSDPAGAQEHKRNIKKIDPDKYIKADTDTSSKGDISLPSEEGTAEICPVCKGAGFIHPALDSGKADFSRVIPCRCSKGELKKKKTEYLEKYSNLGSLSQLTFDNLSPKGKGAGTVSQERFAQIYEAATAAGVRVALEGASRACAAS
jgi:hypothetical protein